jgi:hypothetical protein
LATLGLLPRPEILAEMLTRLILRGFWAPHFLAVLPCGGLLGAVAGGYRIEGVKGVELLRSQVD